MPGPSLEFKWIWRLIFLGLAPLATFGQVPIPEDFLPSGRVGEYVQSATSFLKNNPQDRFAPRVAFDLYVLFSSVGKVTEAEQLRGKVLMDYPHSFQAGYLITTFEDAGKFSKYLDALADSMFSKDPKGVPQGFCRLYSVGLKRFRGHPDITENLPLLLKGYLFAQVASENDLAAHFRKNLALKEISLEKDKERELVQIALSRSTSLEERILQLHAMEGDKLARFLKRVYLSSLDKPTANKASLGRVRILTFLEEKEHAQALGMIETLPDIEKNVPEVLFWKGLCHYGLGQDAEAVAALTRVYHMDPQGEWAETVKAFGEGILSFNQSVEQHADFCQGLVQSMFKEAEVFQVLATFGDESKGKSPMLIYLGVMPGKNFMEVTFTRGDDLFLAYRTTNVDSTLYFKGEEVIHHFPQPGPILSPSLDVERKPDGGFNFNAEASMEANFAVAKKKSQNLLDSPLLNTRNGLRELLAYSFRKQGSCPLPSRNSTNSVIFSGLLPTLQKPGIKSYSVEENPLGKIAKITFPGLQLSGLQYGLETEVQLARPVWPERQIQEHSQLDLPLFLRVFTVFADLVK